LIGSGSAAARRMPGTSPTVEIVIARADSPNPRCSRHAAPQVAAGFANGSPMPMKTTLVRWWGASGPGRSSGSMVETLATCSTTSPAESWRLKPNWPVAQKVQPIAQPAWVEMHTVARSLGPRSQSSPATIGSWGERGGRSPPRL
jgi:hypothetical protein